MNLQLNKTTIEPILAYTFLFFYSYIFIAYYDRIIELLPSLPIQGLQAIASISYSKKEEHFNIKSLLSHFLIKIIEFPSTNITEYPSRSFETTLYGQILALKVCSFIILKLYSRILKIIKEIYDLLRNMTYNPSLKRYDSIRMKADQTIISFFLFLIMFVVFRFILLFYCLFLGITIPINFLEAMLASSLNRKKLPIFITLKYLLSYSTLKNLIAGKCGEMVDFRNKL